MNHHFYSIEHQRPANAPPIYAVTTTILPNLVKMTSAATRNLNLNPAQPKATPPGIRCKCKELRKSAACKKMEDSKPDDLSLT